MSFLANPFSPSSRASNAWFCAGSAALYPDIDDTTRVSEQRACNGEHIPGCRVFHVPREDGLKAREIAIDDWKDPQAGDAKDQVMVFQYKSKFIAINHVRLQLLNPIPHRTFNIMRGMPTFILSFVERNTIRHRRLWGCTELRHNMS